MAAIKSMVVKKLVTISMPCEFSERKEKIFRYSNELHPGA